FAVQGSAFGGTLVHSITITVLVTAPPFAMMNVVSQDQALGCIDNSGIAQALTAKLNETQSSIDGGRVQEAINAETALLNQLNGESGKHIATSCTDSGGVNFNAAQVLITDAQALQAATKTTGVTDPIMGYVVDASGRSAVATISLLSGSQVLETVT